jgi:hypothetical protein
MEKTFARYSSGIRLILKTYKECKNESSKEQIIHSTTAKLIEHSSQKKYKWPINH